MKKKKIFWLFCLFSLLFCIIAIWGSHKYFFPLIFQKEKTSCEKGVLFEDKFNRLSLEGFVFSGNKITSPFVEDPGGGGGGGVVELTLDRLEDSNQYRTELVPVDVGNFFNGSNPQFGVTYWYTFSIFIPNGYVIDDQPECFVQWHGAPDSLFLEQYRNPPLSINIRDAHYEVFRVWDRNIITPGDGKRYDGQEKSVLGSISEDIGKWTIWFFEIRWAYNFEQAGSIKIWKDHEIVFTSRGPNCFNDLRGGPYLKIGIYKWPWKINDTASGLTRRRIYLKNIKIGKPL